jgi:hydroxyethylthiazole kinase
VEAIEAAIAASIARIADQRPLIHAIVNHVAMAAAADAVRALGALPVMAADPEEVGDMTAQASAVVLNTGTPDLRRFDACRVAGRAANAAGIPLVLDPVGMGSTGWRTAEIRRLLDDVRFSAIRGNRSEIAALTQTWLRDGRSPEARSAFGVRPVRGVEGLGANDRAELAELASKAHQQTNAIVCISGPTDVVSGAQVSVIRNGHPLMGQVVGTGCMLSAVMGVFLAVERNAEQAVIQAVVAFGLAGESAARCAQGPGSYRVALIDALAAMQRERTARGARMEVLA